MKAKSPSEILERAVSLEREAYRLRSEQKIEEAFETYDQAASLYSSSGEHLKAAVCYASAASCWNIRTGIQPLRNAASRSALAAEEAMAAGHYNYARSLFVEAAHLYEKDGDSAKYSSCFYKSKLADGKFCWQIFVSGRKVEDLLESFDDAGWRERFLSLGRWVANVLSRLLWGYGERPFRTFAAANFLILVNALIYRMSGGVSQMGEVKPISFLEGLYFSVVTFATVGYGDFVPTGWVRVFAALEGLCGISLVPLFLVALTRRYLRAYR